MSKTHVVKCDRCQEQQTMFQRFSVHELPAYGYTDLCPMCLDRLERLIYRFMMKEDK